MAFDFSSPTDFQRNALRNLAHNSNVSTEEESIPLSEFLFSKDIVWLFLTLDGKRIACDIGSATFEKDKLDLEDDIPQELLDSLPVEYKHDISELSYDEEEKLLSTWQVWPADRDVSQFDLTFENMTPREWGEFYGYPGSAITAYVEETAVNSIDVLETDTEFSIDELKYLALVPYTVSVENDHLEQAIQQGKDWADRIYELAETYPYLVGLQFRVDEVLSEQKEWLLYEDYQRQQESDD